MWLNILQVSKDMTSQSVLGGYTTLILLFSFHGLQGTVIIICSCVIMVNVRYYTLLILLYTTHVL